MVAGFRESVGTDTDDPRFIELVGELSLASPLFSRLWARHDVQACEAAPKHIEHPQVGGLQLNRERLSIDGAPGRTLVVYHPDPGTDSGRQTGPPRLRHRYDRSATDRTNSSASPRSSTSRAVIVGLAARLRRASVSPSPPP
jgi:hypothetical protein